ncbi:uncharacterized protein LOC115470252 [Microcaecilia unicolor]|uniref:Uncharacterized protein LOC115470252 n=1 Tax=Microcaecilia unicolor TaxID=1415580 RepID=A0A6P7Y8J5_9AMPH|nr:uncharacterized protein LOC115470252 [Microcaecilia unicolor]
MLYTLRIVWGVFLLYAAYFPAVMAHKVAEGNTICSNITILYEIADAMECLLHSFEPVASLERSQVNFLVWKYQQILDTFKKAQEKAWNDFTPKNCPTPLAPSNGGLVCVTIANVRYCKPMCNQDYDFAFLRRSRLYEECGQHTGYSWTTQLVGGSRLADCIASSVAVSGQKSAYFHPNMNCQQTMANATAEKEHIRIFLQELAKKDIAEQHEANYDYIICG